MERIVAAAQKPTKRPSKAERMSTLYILEKSVTGRVTRKISRSHCFPNSGVTIPMLLSQMPKATTMISGRVALMLKMKLLMTEYTGLSL